MKKAAQQVGQASSLPFARASLPVVALNRQGPQNQLPNGWRWVKLDDVCEHRTGVRDPRREADKPFRYVDITSVDNKAKSIVEAKTVLGKDAPSRARQIIRSADVIVSTTRPNLNAVALVPPELDGQICSTGFCVLRAKPDLDSDYLFASVQTSDFVERLSGLVKGALYPAVMDKQVREQVIPLPPLSEQKRIAGILKEQMAAVERARHSAEAQLQAAESLPAAYLRAVFNSRESQRWEKKVLGEICIDIYRYPSFYGMEHRSTGVPVIRGEHVRTAGEISCDWTDFWFVSPDVSAKFPRTVLEKGDLVFSVRGTIGKVGIVRESHQGAQISPNLIRISPAVVVNAACH